MRLPDSMKAKYVGLRQTNIGILNLCSDSQDDERDLKDIKNVELIDYNDLMNDEEWGLE